jgi:OOP family OmpA-OmpF porin
MIAKDKKILSLAAPLALAMGLGLTMEAGAMAHVGYTNASGGALMTGYGECWKSKGPTGPMTACGDNMDSDGDGVTDDKDKCPDTPKGVKVDADGCPLDSDGDGVPDYMDKCPGTPAGVKVDANGCPLDSDGDGVPDYKDKCPGTPAGAKVDANGCQIMGDMTIDLVNDEFDFDSAKLKPSMKAALDDVAARVKASKGDEMLMVIGHTDSVGSEAYNQGLSERRAQATADYLVSQGVGADRVSTKGMGESQPVADNGSKAGRSKNRRVEILTK